MLNEIETNHISEAVAKGKLSVVLGYTNMCGTCESAKKMLAIVSELMKDVTFYKVNLNYFPTIAKTYDVKSNPCFMVFKHGVLTDLFYAFHSVTYLYEKINGHLA